MKYLKTIVAFCALVIAGADLYYSIKGLDEPTDEESEA